MGAAVAKVRKRKRRVGIRENRSFLEITLHNARLRRLVARRGEEEEAAEQHLAHRRKVALKDDDVYFAGLRRGGHEAVYADKLGHSHGFYSDATGKHLARKPCYASESIFFFFRVYDGFYG